MRAAVGAGTIAGSIARVVLPACAVLLAAGSSEGGLAQPQPECTGREGPLKLYVDVEGVRSADGLVAVTLYADDSSRFLASRGSLYVGRVPAKSGQTRVCIYLPSAGTYALAVYHDANADRKFDRTGIGLPDEGYGFSNNPAVILGLPSFRSVRLAVPRSDMSTRVKLRYP
ncbi:MAG TPA: DUF2141 domain-containing protein [Croceibacterium sp.]